MTDDLQSIVARVEAHAEAEAFDDAWDAAAPLLERIADEETARALLGLVDDGRFDRARRAEAARRVFETHADDSMMIAALGSVMDRVHDIDFLNSPPASDPIFTEVAERLVRLASTELDAPSRFRVLRGLCNTGRLLGRTWDDVVDRAHRDLVALRPDDWTVHYNQGLFFKTRGRFAEGVDANQRARAAGGDGEQPVMWNLGICATGARDGETALAVWKQLDQVIEMGRDGLPEGSYPMTKVRLAQRPVAERTVDGSEDPGEEETIWVERRSPCHGIVRSALFSDAIGLDYGDIVLFDGAPITYHKYGDQQIPVFPHLVTLKRSGYRIYRFAGTQADSGDIAELSRALPDDAVTYVHTEQYQTLCLACWSDTKLDHTTHEASEPHLVVLGKLCAPPDLALEALLDALDVAAAKAGVEVYVPDARRDAGDDARADVDARRYAMIES